MNKTPHIVIVGGGHAGVEAVAACSRLGVRTTLVTLRADGIGQMSCNPAIGGLGKGQLVKEVDALGGVMGRAIDATGIQFRTLNESKGPAVRSSRAQADRDAYKGWIRGYLETLPHVTIIEGEVAALHESAGKIEAITLKDGTRLTCDAAVLTTGTFLRGLMHTGTEQTRGGRLGDNAAHALSDSLRALGFELGRLKTGTPARLRRSSIDYSKTREQPGDVPAKPFSMMTRTIERPQVSCWITSTSEAVHEVIRSNRERSPMFNGQIKSGGPRYCPSIEDKVFRFADKQSHHIFLEPEGYTSDIVYPNGISTSLPFDVQEKFIRMIPGLEQVEILAPGYAVEYDFVDPRNLTPSFETKAIRGLFFAGQINGTSGYEEAAAQGIVAGANAALSALGREPLLLHRGNSYIGVMIDDLTTLGVDEPYRMFTSRAEYRLILREDNAPARLCPIAREIGLLGSEQRHSFEEHQARYDQLKTWSEKTRIKPSEEINSWLAQEKSAILRDSITVATLVRRPELTLEQILSQVTPPCEVTPDLLSSLTIELKFSGYLARQEEEVAQLKKNEDDVIPLDFSYDAVPSLRTEAREKLKKFRPYSLGQAMRIPGITTSAITLISIYLKKHRELASHLAKSTGTDS
jgi:tRNA uridine 5-carboxymethylaminomethyl modification enzyme